MELATKQLLATKPLPSILSLQVDWHYVQQSHKEAWLELARSAFSSLDTDRDGVLRIDEIVARLAQNLPEAEVRSLCLHRQSCLHASVHARKHGWGWVGVRVGVGMYKCSQLWTCMRMCNRAPMQVL
eukprot:926921-Pelagomonas_calceolata.AAC.1